MPTFPADFNRMPDHDFVLISSTDFLLSQNGVQYALFEGMQITIFDDDLDINGRPDKLIASGLVELNPYSDWSKNVKWGCRIDKDGIKHESDLNQRDNNLPST